MKINRGGPRSSSHSQSIDAYHYCKCHTAVIQSVRSYTHATSLGRPGVHRIQLRQHYGMWCVPGNRKASNSGVGSVVSQRSRREMLRFGNFTGAHHDTGANRFHSSLTRLQRLVGSRRSAPCVYICVAYAADFFKNVIWGHQMGMGPVQWNCGNSRSHRTS